MAEEMAQSMISLGGEDHAVADGAAPVGKGVGGNAAAESKRDRVPAVEQEREKEEDDVEGDMDFINNIQQETAYDTVFTYPDNLTAPLTFSLWEHEVEFYEAMQKLYKTRNAKVGDKGVAKVVDTFSLSVGIHRGWPRAMPLHLLIGYNYLKPLLALSPTGLWLLLDIHQTTLSQPPLSTLPEDSIRKD
jgi:hypothetical protein